MRKDILPLCAALLFSLSACGFEAPAPKRTPPPQTPAPPVSTIAVTLDVPVADIVTMLNKQTAQQIARIDGKKVGCFIAKCKMDMLAQRTGPITGSAQNGGISLTLPFSVDARIQMKGGFFKTGGEASAMGEARAFTTLALTPDWQVRTHTNGDVQLSDSQIQLGPMRTSITDLWNHNDEHLSDEIFKQMDKQIGPAIKLKPQVEKLWARVQQPIKVGKKPPAWLLLTPQALRIGNIQAANDHLIVSLAADVRGQVVIGDTPPVPDKPVPLPRPRALGTPSNAFAFTIPVTLPYEEAANLALDQIKKKPPHVGSTEVKIDKLEILPSGEDVIVAVHFCVAQKWDIFGWFDSCGDGYLRGTPVFDSKTDDVRIVNVHYDIGTQSMILSVMKWLAGDELAQQIQTHLAFNVAHDMDKLEDSVTKALAKPQGKDVVIYGEVQGFGPPTLGWTDKGFLALFTAHGVVHAGLDRLKP
jgi:Domain of unknown function (DUF4403)